MAQIQADRLLARAEQANSLGRLTYGIGSVISVGLVIGMGIWGYKLLVRDVSGVPVIRAAEGPIRIQPEDPGGRQALHQGLSVNAVAAAGSAEAAADRLILAPPPLDLEFIEVSRDESPAAPSPSTMAALPGPDTPSQDTGEGAVPTDTMSAGIAPIDQTLAAVIGDDPDEEERLNDEDVVSAIISDVVAAQSGGVVEGGIGRSLRPRPRPATLTGVQTVSASAADDTIPDIAAVNEVDPDTIPVGTRLAQLGAYKSEEIAREEWTRLAGRFEEYLAGKDRVIQRAESGGRTFYRLRAAGFEDLADARRFCSALVAERAECIPVVTR